MANFYQGYKKENVAGNMVNAAPTPDVNTAMQSNARRTQSLISSIDSIAKAGELVIQTADAEVQKTAKQIGANEAGQGKASSANVWSWGGETQQAAYNQVRGELVVRDMPSTIEQYLKEDKEITKPLDEMSDDERAVAYSRARQRFFKEKGIEGSQFSIEANLAANEVQAKHLSYMNKQATDLRQAKSIATISELVAKDSMNYGGDPKALEASIEANFNKYAIALGGTQQANEAVANGLLKAVTSDKPSLEALQYLKSPEAKKRFGSFEGFDKVVQQAEVHTQKVKNAYADEVRKQAESGFYINLSGGAFTNKKEVDDYLNSTNLDAKTKFDLTNKALRYLKQREGAVSIQPYIDSKQYNVVNAQKPEVLEEAFSINVGSPGNMNLQTMTIQQENALVNWVKNGYNVPKWVAKFGDSPLNNGDTKSLDAQLNLYSKLKARLGETGVGTIFSSNTQAKLDEWARLRTDTTLAPSDRKKVLDEFDRASQVDITGSSVNLQIRKELDVDDGIGGQILNFVSEGGSNIFGGKDDLQPLTTFSDMTTDADSAPSLNYAKNAVSGNYATYRRAGLTQEQALKRAQDDFQARNQWVEWTYGKSKNTYIPKEFGDDFANKSMTYLEKTKVLDRIALEEGTTVEEVKKAVTIQPARDYNATRRVSVFYNGIEKSIGFNADQFHKEQGLLKRDEIQKIIQETRKRNSSPEWIKQQKNLSTVQSIMRGLGF